MGLNLRSYSLMSFFNVVFQSDADISVFAAQSNLFRTQHFNILHRNFGHTICAPVEFLFLGSQPVDVKLAFKLGFGGHGRRRGFHQLERFGLGRQLNFGMDGFLDGRLGANLRSHRYWP